MKWFIKFWYSPQSQIHRHAKIVAKKYKKMHLEPESLMPQNSMPIFKGKEGKTSKAKVYIEDISNAQVQTVKPSQFKNTLFILNVINLSSLIRTSPNILTSKEWIDNRDNSSLNGYRKEVKNVKTQRRKNISQKLSHKNLGKKQT